MISLDRRRIHPWTIVLFSSWDGRNFFPSERLLAPRRAAPRRGRGRQKRNLKNTSRVRAFTYETRPGGYPAAGGAKMIYRSIDAIVFILCVALRFSWAFAAPQDPDSISHMFVRCKLQVIKNPRIDKILLFPPSLYPWNRKYVSDQKN